ncbi:MAG: PD-(D/E)XK nuclease domain-containing protein, partial [Prevotella sp.]|nr:PD-(D/E)XK nuclease domain-containing protein [Prevotella sp.]
PNLEVEQGFTNFLLPFYIKNKDKKASDFLDNFVCDVEEGRPECFMSSMKTLLDGNSYQIAGKLEIYFQNVMCLIFKIMGFYTQVEYATSDGRIDIVVKTKNYIYLIEVKVDVPADEALAQIEAKDYAKVFAADERKLYKIGVCFSNKTRSISEYKIKT